jgi:NAD(P)-dependent dehydrogenase (short-subunit alcohol dehydrogenase family)
MWNTVIGINLTGQFFCCREAVREFLRRGVRKEVSCAAGKIISMSSVHQINPWAGRVDYAASKGGIAMMMQSIAQEVAHQRIRVNSIAPQSPNNPNSYGPGNWPWKGLPPEAYMDIYKQYMSREPGMLEAYEEYLRDYYSKTPDSYLKKYYNN